MVSQIFLSRAHRSSRPRDTLARVVFARASTHISKANVGGAGKMSHCSRKNQMRCVERTFLCPSSSSCFDRSKSYREASKIANGRANSPSPQKTRRRVLCSWNTKRHDALCMGRRAPQICAEDLLVVCVSFFSRWFFFRRVLGKNNAVCLVFCVRRRTPAKQTRKISLFIFLGFAAL